MTPQIHRLVFSKSLGCLMAVGENARSAGGGCSGARRNRGRQANHGSTSQTLNQTQINGKVNIATGIHTTVMIPEGDLKTQVQQLSQQPGMAYIGELAKDPRINW